MMHGQQQLQPQCIAQRQPTAALHQPAARFQWSSVHRQLQQHRLPRGSFLACPARFADASHVAYYEPPTAGSKKEKVGKRIKMQRKRLQELGRQASERGGQPSPTQWSQLVQELQEMCGSLSDVAKMAASSSSSSSSSSESEDSDGSMPGLQLKGRSLPQLPALARLASAAPPVVVPSSFSVPAAAQKGSRAPLGGSSSSVTEPAAILAARPAATASVGGGSPAAAEPELARVLRLRDSADTQQPAGAALLHEAASSTATSPAAGRDTNSSSSSQQSDAVAAAPRSNIVTAPAPAAARVEVCQGKSCAKRGAVDLLRQASAAGAGVPGVQVSGCKCLGKCKQGPAVRVRAGRERPTVLTQAAKDGGAKLAALMERQVRQRAQELEAAWQLETGKQRSDSQERVASC